MDSNVRAASVSLKVKWKWLFSLKSSNSKWHNLPGSGYVYIFDLFDIRINVSIHLVAAKKVWHWKALVEFRDWSIDFPSNGCSHYGTLTYHIPCDSCSIYHSIYWFIDPFHVTGFFLYSRKKENQRFPDVFRGCKNRLVTWNVLMRLCFLLNNYIYIGLDYIEYLR